MGELSLIEKFKAGAPGHPWITVGPGSDCAVLNWPGGVDQLFKIDQVVEGTHFVLSGPEAATPFQVGWKAMAKTCSDIAAAGGWPVAAMVAMNVRRGTLEAVTLGVYHGLVQCCKEFDFGLAGGDFSSSENGLSVVVSLLGKCRYGGAWTRGGAQPGDALFVTGSLGGSRGGKHLRFGPRLKEARFIRDNCPRSVKAAIDITDGLSRDLKHICAESGCGAIIDEAAVPMSESLAEFSRSVALTHALNDGEDFELLLAVDAAHADELAAKWDRKVALTRIGEIVEKELGVSIRCADGQLRPMQDGGYEHVV